MSLLHEKIVYIPCKNLSVIWVQSQRPFDKVWAKNICDNFDPDLFDPIIVTMPNGEGKYHIIEGQHRKAALEMYAAKCSTNNYGGNEQAPCRIVGEANPQRAAEIWLVNASGRKAVSAVAEFKVAVVAKREPEASIDKIVRTNGFQVSAEHRDACISCVAALAIVYTRHGPVILGLTLHILRTLWGLNPQAVSNALVRGFAIFLNEFPNLSITRLKKISDRFDPWRLIEAAKIRKETTREKVDEAICELLIREYNKGIKDPDNRLKHKV